MFPWHDIDTVLLDMDGTLLDLHFDNYFWLHYLPERYAETHRVSLETAKSRLHAHYKAHHGTLNWYCLEFWGDSLQMNIRALKEEVKHLIKIRPFVVEFLRRLREHGKRLILITNAHPQSLDLKLEVTHIDQWLDMVISSHQLQYPKEEQAFWQCLMIREQFDPARTLFIDDSPRILQSALDFGVRHVLGIRHPDSQQAPCDLSPFPAIDHFDELLPTLPIIDTDPMRV
jgi:putative hydrolase of the HAD superfamily